MNQPLLLVPRSQSMRLTEHWHVVKDGDSVAKALHSRHYSKYKYKDGRDPALFIGPGEKLVLLNEDGTAVWAWRFFTDDYLKRPSLWCSIFRNESDVLSSLLILEAERVAGCRWPGKSMFTIVDPTKVRSTNPGCCYKKAGWKFYGLTKKGQHVLWKSETLNESL